MKPFLIAGGSVPGSDHRAPLRQTNCQDAFAIWSDEDTIIAVASDGNGENPHSEAGAKIGTRLLVSSLRNQLRRAASLFGESASPEEITEVFARTLRRAEQDLLSQIRVLANAMTPQGESFSQTIREHFQFTLIGIVVMKHWAGVFYTGDGVYAINGEVSVIGPFPENKPPYPAYQLIETEDYPPDSRHIRLQVATVLPTVDLESAFIGTDGVEHLIKAEDSPLPGRKDKVGPLSQFWEDSNFVENADAVRRRLALITRDAYTATTGRGGAAQLVTEPGLLKDDTTIVVIRRA